MKSIDYFGVANPFGKSQVVVEALDHPPDEACYLARCDRCEEGNLFIPQEYMNDMAQNKLEIKIMCPDCFKQEKYMQRLTNKYSQRSDFEEIIERIALEKQEAISSLRNREKFDKEAAAKALEHSLRFCRDTEEHRIGDFDEHYVMKIGKKFYDFLTGEAAVFKAEAEE